MHCATLLLFPMIWVYFSVYDISYGPYRTFLALNMSRDQFKKWHEEHTAKTDAVDQRVCLLCGAVGDGSPNGPSR